MLSLKKCLRDIVNAWPKISVGTQTGSLKIGSLLIQWGNTSMTIPSGANAADKFIDFPVKYSLIPAVFGQCTFSTNYPDLFNITINTISTTRFSMGFRNNYATKYTIPAVWIAIGKA